jgi:hypothetical protein
MVERLLLVELARDANDHGDGNMSFVLATICAFQLLISIGVVVWALRAHARAEQRYKNLAFEIGVSKAQIQRLNVSVRSGSRMGLPQSFPLSNGDYRQLSATGKHPVAN